MLTSSSATFWFQFFLDSGIPADDAGRYAGSFSQNRITSSMAIDLTKDHLEQLGINTLGDCIAILKHAKDLYAKDLREKSITKSVPKTISEEMVTASKSSEVPLEIKKAENKSNSLQMAELIAQRVFNASLDVADIKLPEPKEKSVEVKKKEGGSKPVKEEEELLYVEHKIVDPKLQKTEYKNGHTWVHKKKVATKRSFPTSSKSVKKQNNKLHSESKKSVFDRLGTEKMDENKKICNQLDIGNVFDRLGERNSKKRKVSVIINEEVYETSEDDDDEDDEEDNFITPNRNLKQKRENLKEVSSALSKTISAGVLSVNSIQPDKFIKSSAGIFSPHSIASQSSLSKRLGKKITPKRVEEKEEGGGEALSEAQMREESKRLARFVKAELIKSTYQEKTLEKEAVRLKTSRLIASNIIGPDRLSTGAGTMQMDKNRVKVFDRLGPKTG